MSDAYVLVTFPCLITHLSNVNTPNEMVFLTIIVR